MIDWVHHDSVTTVNPPLPFEVYLKSVKKPQTHADRIRAMTDEELAEWIAGRYPDCPPGVSPAPIGCDDVCAGCWLEWLRQEADNG